MLLLTTVFEGLDHVPVVSLEYPAFDASEEYLLLVPSESDEYDPISDLLSAVGAMIAHYVPPDMHDEFGAHESLETSSNAGMTLSKVHASSSRLRNAIAQPNRDDVPATAENDTIVRSFNKARNRRNGPLFVRTLERFNAKLRELKERGALQAQLETLGQTYGVPEHVWRTVQEQVYARVAAPHVEKLKQYEAFSDNVYGEMLPPFLSEIARISQLGPNSVFVDLGSGIGNLLIQASLQTGCEAYGCEYMPIPSDLATRQILEASLRWRLWNLRGGPKLEAWNEDFTRSERVGQVLRNADVVLVNKYVHYTDRSYAFRPQTNDTLSLQFLDLKDGARIFSLRPFVAPDFRLTERTLSSPQAILRVEQRQYTSGCVSWTGGGGVYYVQTVDRQLVRDFVEARTQNGSATTA